MNYPKARAECVRQAEASPGVQFYVIPEGRAFLVVSFEELMAASNPPRPVYAYYHGEIGATETVFEPHSATTRAAQ